MKVYLWGEIFACGVTKIVILGSSLKTLKELMLLAGLKNS